MKTVNVHDAKTHLSRLIAEVADGQEVVIAKAGKPIARLVGLTAAKPRRTPGFLRGKIWIADDFDAPLPEHVQADFENSL